MKAFVDKLAQRIATFPTAALAATKDAVNGQAPLKEPLDRDIGRFVSLVQSPEAQAADKVLRIGQSSATERVGGWAR